MRFRRQQHEHDEGTQRIEAFSDGVFAIAITLLIIEIGVPVVTSEHGLSYELRHLWPEYGAYVLSFVTIGIYWANHNHFFKHFVRSDHFFLMLNVFFLMAIAFVPFPTAVLGEYLDDAAERKTAVAFYILGLVLPAVGWLSIWLYGQQDHLIDENLHPDYCRFLTLQYTGSVSLYVLALVIALWQPYVGLVITAVLTAVYLLPPRRREYVAGAAGEHAGGDTLET
jgi:uncharacterized membrane protein